MVISPLPFNVGNEILTPTKALRPTFHYSDDVKSHLKELFMPQSMDRSLTATPRARRVTREEVVKLKVNSEPKGPKSLFRGIGNFFKSIGHMLSAKPSAKAATSCKTSGHVMPASGWQAGKFPHCVDCGKRIDDPTKLRNSVWKK